MRLERFPDGGRLSRLRHCTVRRLQGYYWQIEQTSDNRQQTTEGRTVRQYSSFTWEADFFLTFQCQCCWPDCELSHVKIADNARLCQSVQLTSAPTCTLCLCLHLARSHVSPTSQILEYVTPNYLTQSGLYLLKLGKVRILYLSLWGCASLFVLRKLIKVFQKK